MDGTDSPGTGASSTAPVPPPDSGSVTSPTVPNQSYSEYDASVSTATRSVIGNIEINPAAHTLESAIDSGLSAAQSAIKIGLAIDQTLNPVKQLTGRVIDTLKYNDIINDEDLWALQFALIMAGTELATTGPQSPSAPLGDLAVTPASEDELLTAVNTSRELGMDPATGAFRQGEYNTAIRVQQERGVVLQRSPNPSLDWVDDAGKTYDAVGNFNAKFFDQQWPNLQTRILDHMEADFVPVDVSGFTAEQIAKVQQFIAPLGPSVFIVGK